MGELDGKAAVVVGGGRGLGRGIAQSLSAAGASVLAIARHPTGLDELQAANPSIETAIGDATDPDLAAEAVASRDPDILAVVAGAGPSYRPLQDHSWETFSLNWDVDVRLTFNWLREALREPLRPGSRVLVMSSGAALQGSPLSGGYAGRRRRSASWPPTPTRSPRPHRLELPRSMDALQQGMTADVRPAMTPARPRPIVHLELETLPAASAFHARPSRRREAQIDSEGPAGWRSVVVTPEGDDIAFGQHERKGGRR